MTMPNFLVIGAAKAGTSALCDYLEQHPDVYMSPAKEPMFFVAECQPEIPYRGPRDREVLLAEDSGWVSTLDAYHRLFAGATTERAIGEGSTWYLYDERAPGRIRHHVPDARLIALLRNPVDRAYSAFTMLVMDGRETTTSFSEALDLEDRRVRDCWEAIWHYRRMGLYHDQLRRYYDLFDRDQILVVLYDDWNARPVEVMRDVLQFLDVDPGFTFDMSERSNVTLIPKNPSYQRMLTRQSRLKTVAKALLPASFRQRAKEKLVYSTLARPAPMEPDVRRRLVEVFRPDVLELQDLLGRDLGRWLA